MATRKKATKSGKRTKKSTRKSTAKKSTRKSTAKKSTRKSTAKKSTRRKSTRKYGKKASKSVESAMRRRKKGTLRSGKGGRGGKVKSREQAIAIGLEEAREKGAKVPPRRR
jgi:hypothetical protein